MLAALVTRQLVLDGVVNGLVIGLIAMGLVLVYRSTRVINFAVGSMGVVSASVLVLLVVNYKVPVLAGAGGGAGDRHRDSVPPSTWSSSAGCSTRRG